MMVRTDKGIGMWKMFTVAPGCLLILALAGSPAWADQKSAGIENDCTFSKLLGNPTFRARYKQKLASESFSSHEGPSDSSKMYGNIVNASISNDDGEAPVRLDAFSTGCVACHDGIVSPKDALNFKNDPGSRMQMISGKHPIGMDYEKYAAANRDLKKPERLNPRMILVGGKVSCITCHDPLNPAKYHLAMNDNGRGLCLECHML